jgi:hypothetical protein
MICQRGTPKPCCAGAANFIFKQRRETGWRVILSMHWITMKLESGFDRVTLWALEANRRARSFYESFGFTPDGAMKDDDQWKGFAVREVRCRLELK